MLDAAERCFLEWGYAATTMKDIAATAAVSVQTVFGQGSKASLLLRCVDRSLTGDDEEASLLEREEFVRLMGEGPLVDKLDALREIAVHATPRTAPMARVFAAAAAGDPEIAASYAEYGRRRYQDSRAVVGAFERWMRPDLDVDRATDVFWAVFSHETAAALLEERGWSPESYADWLVDTIDRLLLEPR